MPESFPLAREFFGSINNELSRRRRIDSRFNLRACHFRDRFPVGRELRTILRAQDADLVALRFPIENEPLLFARFEKGKIDNSFQTSALVHSPEERYLRMREQLSAGEKPREIWIVLQILEEQFPFIRGSLCGGGFRLVLFENLFP